MYIVCCKPSANDGTIKQRSSAVLAGMDANHSEERPSAAVTGARNVIAEMTARNELRAFVSAL